MKLLIIIYLLYNLSDAWGDVSIELGRQKDWHMWGAVQVCLFYAVLSFALFGFSWYAAICFVGLVLFRLPTFNLMHNLIKGDKWNYLSDNGIDGFLKRLFK
jgi:hypothetical protein